MEKFNYYNYFTEVEEIFISLRGAPMWISPLDWSLIESWKNMGIPLHVVLRGINQSFASYDPLSNRNKRVNTLFYCQQEVISNFKDYVQSQVGANTTTQSNTESPASSKSSSSSSIFNKQDLVNFVEKCREDLNRAYQRTVTDRQPNLREALERAISRLKDVATEINQTNGINTEGLERDLALLEELIYDGLYKDIDPAQLSLICAEADEQLRPHKKRMEADVYKQTRENYIAKRLRQHHFIPRLSLFYMI